MYNEQLSQELSVADKIDPASQAAGTYNTTGVDMQKFHRVMYEIQIGSVGGAGTVDAKLQSATDSGFTTPHNLTAITQVTAGNKRVTIKISDEAVEQNNHGDRYVRLQVTIGTNAVVFGATGFGGVAAQDPANAQDIAAVAQRLVIT